MKKKCLSIVSLMFVSLIENLTVLAQIDRIKSKETLFSDKVPVILLLWKSSNDTAIPPAGWQNIQLTLIPDHHRYES